MPGMKGPKAHKLQREPTASLMATGDERQSLKKKSPPLARGTWLAVGRALDSCTWGCKLQLHVRYKGQEEERKKKDPSHPTLTLPTGGHQINWVI